MTSRCCACLWRSVSGTPRCVPTHSSASRWKPTGPQCFCAIGCCSVSFVRYYYIYLRCVVVCAAMVCVISFFYEFIVLIVFYLNCLSSLTLFMCVRTGLHESTGSTFALTNYTWGKPAGPQIPYSYKYVRTLVFAHTYMLISPVTRHVDTLCL